MFRRPVLEWVLLVPQSITVKRFYRFPSLVLLKDFGSPDHYWKITLDSPVHAILVKGSVGSSVLYWEKGL